MLRQWAEEFAAAAAAGTKKRAGVRRGSRGSADDLEALGGLGAALVEGLARLARSHIRWQAREEAEVRAAVQRGEEPRELSMDDIDVVKVWGKGGTQTCWVACTLLLDPAGERGGCGAWCLIGLVGAPGF